MATGKRIYHDENKPFCELTLTKREHNALSDMLGNHSASDLRQLSKDLALGWDEEDIAAIEVIFSTLCGIDLDESRN